MPRKPPPKHSQFKPGKSGNPSGRPALNPIFKALKNLTVQSYREVIEKVCTGNIDALRIMAEDSKTSALQLGVVKSMIKAIMSGDYATIDRIAERVVGKIPDELNVNSTNTNLNSEPIDPIKLKEARAKLLGRV